jgi:hypothetical protein
LYKRWDPAWLRFVQTQTSCPEDTVALDALLEVRSARWSRRQIRDDETYHYFEVADADLETGEVREIRKISGFELLKKGRIRVQVQSGDILLPNHRDSLMAASVPNGRSAVLVNAGMDGVLTTDRFIVLRSKIDPTLLLCLLNSRGVRRQLIAQCRGAASLDIREQMFANVHVPKALLSGQVAESIIGKAFEVNQLRDRMEDAARELEQMVEPPFGDDGPIRPRSAR